GPELLRRRRHAHPGRGRALRARLRRRLRAALPARGREPRLVVGSRSVMVYRPKPDLGDRLPAPWVPQVLTGERVLELAVRPAGVDHEREVMPLLLAELRRALRDAGHHELADDAALIALLFPFGRRGGGP